MKKLIIFILTMFFLTTLFGCEDTRIREIKNVVWKENNFKLVVTSEQLQDEQHNDYAAIDPSKLSKYLSSLCVNDTLYYCTVYLSNNIFRITLIEPTTPRKVIYFFGNNNTFLFGRYHYSDLTKEQNKKYNYSLKIRIVDMGQYYEYCVAKGLSFPNTITLYGYPFHQ